MPLGMSLQTLQKERNTILGLVVDYFRHLWSDVWFYGKTLSVTVAGKLPGESGVLFPPRAGPLQPTRLPRLGREQQPTASSVKLDTLDIIILIQII